MSVAVQFMQNGSLSIDIVKEVVFSQGISQRKMVMKSRKIPESLYFLDPS